MKTLPGRRDDLPRRDLHWSLHRAGEFRDGARVVAVCEKKPVRAVNQVVVREGLEEFNGFHIMVGPAPRGWGPARPVNGNIFGVALSKSIPKRTSRSGIPSIVQRRHQIDQLFLFHGQPLPRIIGVFQETLPIPCDGLTHPSPGMNPFSTRLQVGVSSMRGPECVLPARCREWPRDVDPGRAGPAGGLQVRGELRGVDATRTGRAGPPEPGHGRQDPVPRLPAKDHGPDGRPQPGRGHLAGDPEGFLSERPNMDTATTVARSSRMPIPIAVTTKTTVHGSDVTIDTGSGPGMRK